MAKTMTTRRGATLLLAATALAACSPGYSAGGGSDADLVGPEWRLIEAGGVAAAGGERAPYMTVSQGGDRVEGSTGCNRFSGPIEVADGALQMGPLVMTRMACAEPAMNAQEGRVIAALEAADGHRVEGDVLLLLDGDAVVARFERQ